jgi:hypothetical protein
MVLLEQIGKGLVGEFLHRFEAITSQQIERRPRLRVKFNKLSVRSLLRSRCGTRTSHCSTNTCARARPSHHTHLRLELAANHPGLFGVEQALDAAR